MKRLAIVFFVIIVLLSRCAQPSNSSAASYKQITQEEAKEMMTKNDGHIIVDAVLIPNESITDKQPEELPDLDQIILIYCRSGRRSKEASQKLTDIGYTNVYEFGGINTWTGEIVK